jgi:hypothetical protein
MDNFDIAVAGFAAMSTCILTRYVFELYQKYSFLVSKKNKLLGSVLDSIESPSFILDNTNCFYWANKSAKRTLGVVTGSPFTPSIFANKQLRRKLFKY